MLYTSAALRRTLSYVNSKSSEYISMPDVHVTIKSLEVVHLLCMFSDELIYLFCTKLSIHINKGNKIVIKSIVSSMCIMLG